VELFKVFQQSVRIIMGSQRTLEGKFVVHETSRSLEV
jgi:hypothetical protein